MEKKMKLRTMVMLTASLPLAVLAIMLSRNAVKYYNNYETAVFTSKIGQLMEANAKLVSEMQKERGKSAVYAATGHQNKGGVEAQRLNADKALKNQQQVLQSIGFTPKEMKIEYLAESLSMPKTLADLRKTVDSKTTLKNTLTSYTGVIVGLLLDPLKLKAQVTPELYSEMLVAKSLEVAQENAGKLRANLSSVLKKDVPIDAQKISLLTTLKGEVESNLFSKLLSKTDAQAAQIEAFNKSADWSEVRSAFLAVMQKSELGGYGWKDKDFFATITTSVNRIVKIVGLEMDNFNDNSQKYTEESFNSLIMALSLLVGSVLFTYLFMLFFTKKIENRLSNTIDHVKRNVALLTTISNDLHSSSQKVQKFVAEQAASVEESASALEEISSMTKSNAESANQAHEKVNQSQSFMNESKEKMIRLVARAKDLQGNNEKIKELVDTVVNIGQKTDVINDIAFQTKLLSFNAAVEAERAAEHGRGFSVVAQEVGNLAKVSGNAANEISSMVKSGVHHSEKVLANNSDTTSEVNLSVQDSEKSIQNALSSIEEILEMSQSIARASNEQSTGISEVNLAISNIEEGANRTANVSKEASELSNRIVVQLEEINQSIAEISALVSDSGYASKKLTPQSNVTLLSVSQTPQGENESWESLGASDELKKAG